MARRQPSSRPANSRGWHALSTAKGVESRRRTTPFAEGSGRATRRPGLPKELLPQWKHGPTAKSKPTARREGRGEKNRSGSGGDGERETLRRRR